MKKFVILPAVLACMLLMGGVNHAQGSPPPPGPCDNLWSGPQGHMVNMLLELNLTDAQKHDIAVILKEHRNSVSDVLVNMAAARKQLFELVSADAINEEAIRQAFRKAADYEEDLTVLRAKLMQEIKGVLTPEQKTTLHNMKAEMRSRMKDRIEQRKTLIDDWIDTYSK
jgi:protein CpxP